jgi:hypothetical protein
VNLSSFKNAIKNKDKKKYSVLEHLKQSELSQKIELESNKESLNMEQQHLIQ